MRIGLLGAPEVGKSKLARALGKEFGLTVVDNYVQRLRKKTDLALGPWSSYSELFMVAGHRLAEEERVGDDRITVGTIIDTLVYAAVHGDVAMQGASEVRNAYLFAQAAMQGFTLMFRETWDYDLAFYLPYSDDQRKTFNGTWNSAVDVAYPIVVDQFGVPYVYTVTGDHDNRFNIIKDAIKLAQEQVEAAETE